MADKYIKNIKIPNNTTDSFHPKLANQLTAGSKKFDGSSAISITASDLGALTGTINTSGLGGARVGKKYTGAVSSFAVGSGTTAPSLNALSTTAGKYYAVEADSSGLLFVNVPWTGGGYSQKAPDVGLGSDMHPVLLGDMKESTGPTYSSASLYYANSALHAKTEIYTNMIEPEDSEQGQVSIAGIWHTSQSNFDNLPMVEVGRQGLLFASNAGAVPPHGGGLKLDSVLNEVKLVFYNQNAQDVGGCILNLGEGSNPAIIGSGVLSLLSFTSVDAVIDDGSLD